MAKKVYSPQKNSKSLKSQLPLILLVGVIILLGAVMILSNQRNPAVQVINPDTYNAKFLDSNTPHFLLDVRTPSEFAGGHLANAANINVDDLANRLSQVPKDVPVVIYCRSGNRSAIASNILAEAGYTQIYDLGGIIEWQKQSYPIES